MNLIHAVPPEAKMLGEMFTRHGYGLRMVGGAVRDAILGLIQKDHDLCTDATPDQMIELAKHEGITVLPTGILHGTMTFLINRVGYEITTLRIDKHTDGRHAFVEFSKDWEQDAARRDLTINAMSVDLITGELFDYFGGVQDLQNGVVRFVGKAEDRIREDYLRILRYVRFYGRFGKQHDQEILVSMLLLADKLGEISGERIWMELSKIVAHDSAPQVLDDVRKIVVPHLVNYVLRYNRPRFERTHRLTRNPITLLATMIDMAVPSISLVNERLHLSADEFRLLRYLIERVNVTPTLAYVKDMCTSKNVGPAYAMEFCAFHGDLHTYNYVRTWEVPTFPVTGKVLLEQGMGPGPEMGRVLARLEDIWKDSDYVLTLQDLLALV